MESIAADLRFMQRTPLEAEHVEALREAGEEIVVAKGTIIASVGQRMDTFYYLLEGEVEVIDPLSGERYLPNTLGPRQFMGEISFLNGGAYSMPMRAAADTRLLAVKRVDMLELMTKPPRSI